MNPEHHPTSAVGAHAHDAEHAPKQKGPIMAWLTTTDHKKIGIMYLVTAFFFFICGGAMAMVIRAQLMQHDGGLVSLDFYNQMMTMHPTFMIFLAIIPALAGFGNYALPLHLGAKDVAFPRLNALGFWLIPMAGIVLTSSFFFGGASQNGWVAYPPLSTRAYSPNMGVDLWIFGLHLAGTSSILGGLNFIATIMNMRAPGLTLHKMSLFSWSWLVTSWLQVIGTPVLAGAITMLLFDRNLGTAFFKPEMGGDPILYQHLFWFYSHPAVYIMILPVFGIISQVVPAFSQKRIFGYIPIAYSSIAIGFFGFLVWAHHMFATGINPWVLTFFMLVTMLIAVPTGIKIFSWIATMWGGVVTLNTPMLFAIGFIAFFTIGGLSGVYLSVLPFDLHAFGTYFVVAHIHYVLFAGSIMGMFAGAYYWWPKMTGKRYNEKLGLAHFWITSIALNCTYLPMHVLGIEGMPRRIAVYAPQFEPLNQFISISAFVLGAAQLLFAANLIWTHYKGERITEDDPWHHHPDTRTFEWETTTPPPHDNFATPPVVR
ncbi:MAG: cytochrome c oxidase subunit I [Candidatus Sericytochromatia bacterium]